MPGLMPVVDPSWNRVTRISTFHTCNVGYFFSKVNRNPMTNLSNDSFTLIDPI